MNAKSWLTAFGLVSLLLIAGAGYFCFSAYRNYSERLGVWDGKSGSVRSLEAKVPYPSRENVDQIQKLVDDYNAAVEGLFNSLNQFQKPLNTTLSPADFQNLVKTKVAEYGQFAQASKFKIDSTVSSLEGFAQYDGLVPAREVVPFLDFELSAIDNLLRNLATSGAIELFEITRDPIPGEAGGPEKPEVATVQRYPLRLRFSTTHEGFQNFLNKVSNDRSFFYAIRVLQLSNDKQDGPSRKAEEEGGPRYVKTDTQEPATPEKMAEWGWPNAAPSDVKAKAGAAGYSQVSKARILIGEENLEVFMVIDIVRFVSPEEVKALEEEESKNRRATGGRSKAKP